jgi:hypothetical protein
MSIFGESSAIFNQQRSSGIGMNTSRSSSAFTPLPYAELCLDRSAEPGRPAGTERMY